MEAEEKTKTGIFLAASAQEKPQVAEVVAVGPGARDDNGKLIPMEVKVGEGLANVPEVVARLKAVGYKGNYIIEREIRGEQQTKDIADTKKYLEGILKGE